MSDDREYKLEDVKTCFPSTTPNIWPSDIPRTTYLNSLLKFLLTPDMLSTTYPSFRIALNLFLGKVIPRVKFTESRIAQIYRLVSVNRLAQTAPAESDDPLPHLRFSPRKVKVVVRRIGIQHGLPVWMSEAISKYISRIVKQTQHNRDTFQDLQHNPHLPTMSDASPCCPACAESFSDPSWPAIDQIKSFFKTRHTRRKFHLEHVIHLRPDISRWLDSIRTTPICLNALGIYALFVTTSATLSQFVTDLRTLGFRFDGNCHHRIQDHYKVIGPTLLNCRGRMGIKLPEHLYYSLDNLFGFFPRIDQTAILEDVRDWVGGGSIEPSEAVAHLLSYDEFQDMIPQESIGDIKVTEETILFDCMDFFSPGVASGVKWMWGYGDERRSGTPTKTQHMLSLTDSELRAAMSAPLPEVASAFVKIEPAKARGVVSVGLENFCCISPHLGLLQRAFTRFPGLIMYRSQVGQLASHFIDDDEWCCPLDYSGFDHLFGGTHVRGFMFLVYRLIERLTDSATRNFLTNSLNRWFARPHPKHIRIFDQDIRCRGGILSGWRLTAIGDSLINGATLQAADRTLHAIFGGRFLTSWRAAGDDADIRSLDPLSLCSILSVPQLNGAVIHPQKTYLSQSRSEFLRNTNYKGGYSRAYPARLISSLCYFRPSSDEASIPRHQVFNAFLNDWSKMLRRCGRVGDPGLNKVLRTYLSRTFQLPRGPTRRFLHTPTSLGGAGFAPLIPMTEGGFVRLKDPDTQGKLEAVGKLNRIYTRLEKDLGSEWFWKHVSKTVSRDLAGILSRPGKPPRLKLRLEKVPPPQCRPYKLDAMLRDNFGSKPPWPYLRWNAIPFARTIRTIALGLRDACGIDTAMFTMVERGIINLQQSAVLRRLLPYHGFADCLTLLADRVHSMAVRCTQLADGAVSVVTGSVDSFIVGECWHMRGRIPTISLAASLGQEYGLEGANAIQLQTTDRQISLVY